MFFWLLCGLWSFFHSVTLSVLHYFLSIVFVTGTIPVEVCGTPGYLAPELLKAAMYDDAPGYNESVDVLVFFGYF